MDIVRFWYKTISHDIIQMHRHSTTIVALVQKIACRLFIFEIYDAELDYLQANTRKCCSQIWHDMNIILSWNINEVYIFTSSEDFQQLNGTWLQYWEC